MFRRGLFLVVLSLFALEPVVAYDSVTLGDYLPGVWELRTPWALVTNFDGAPRPVYPSGRTGRVVGTLAIGADTLRLWDVTGDQSTSGRPFHFVIAQHPEGRSIVVVSDVTGRVGSWSCWVIDDDTVVFIAPPGQRGYPVSLLYHSFLARRLSDTPGNDSGKENHKLE